MLALLADDFIPVAIDQWNTRRQNDSVGDLWRTIAGQGPRNDFEKTTQGLYIADASGGLIAFNNNRGPERIRQMLATASGSYVHPEKALPIDRGAVDRRFEPEVPDGTAIVRVSARVLGGYPEPRDRWQSRFQRAISRDNLWITAEEQAALAEGKVPDSLVLRIVRFHLVDNTRGEPPTWRSGEIQTCQLQMEGSKLIGKVLLQTEDKKRGFEAVLRGEVDFDRHSSVLKDFVLIAEGEFWGSGPYTGDPPPGRYPLRVGFQLADGQDIADELLPHASRGWVEGYLDPKR